MNSTVPNSQLANINSRPDINRSEPQWQGVLRGSSRPSARDSPWIPGHSMILLSEQPADLTAGMEPGGNFWPPSSSYFMNILSALCPLQK